MNTQKSIPPLPSEEWNFTSYEFGLEGGRLQACHSYEFARELPSVIEEYKRDEGTPRNFKDDVWVVGLFKKGEGDPEPIDCFPYMGYSYFDLNWLEPGEGIKLEHVIIQVWKGFPGKPFLSLPKKTKPVEVYIIPPHRPLAAIKEESPGIWVDARRRLASEEELFQVRIDWSYSNDAIIAEFKEWLSEPGRRPKEAENKRGKGGERKLLADLKALGAVRLMRHFNGSIAEAKKFTADMSHNKCPLYGLDEDWKVAKTRVGALLEDWGSRTLMGRDP